MPSPPQDFVHGTIYLFLFTIDSACVKSMTQHLEWSINSLFLATLYDLQAKLCGQSPS